MAFGGKIMALDSAYPDDVLAAIRRGLHDLNNQLALVVGNADMLGATPTLSDDALELVAAVLDGAERASRLAGDLQRVVRTAADADLPARLT